MKSSNRPRRPLSPEVVALALIVLVAALVRIVFAALPRVVHWDEVAYQLIARNLLAGRDYMEVVGARDLQQPPLVAYISVIGQFLGLVPAWRTAAISHVLLGSLLPLPVYGLARGVSGGSVRVGLVAALLVALHPALAVSPLYWGTMTEPPYVFFIMVALWAAWRWAHGEGRGWALAVGIACGLAYLTRPEAIAYLAICLAFVLLSTWHEWRVQVGPLVLALVAFVVVMLPYVVYVHRVTGRWTMSGKQGISSEISGAFTSRDGVAHDRAVASLDSRGKEIMWLSTEQYDSGLTDWIRQNPTRFLRQVLVNIGDTWRGLFQQDLLDPWLAAIALFGITAYAWTRRRLRRELLLVMAFLPLVSLWVFFILSRFLVVAVPLILIWTAGGIDLLSERLAGVSHSATGQALMRGLPLALIIAGFMGRDMSVVSYETARLPFWRVGTAAWLNTLALSSASPVMMRDTEVALYSGLPAVAFPSAAWPQVRAYGRARGARYLLVEDSEIRKYRPQMSGILDPAHPLPGLQFVAERDEQGERTLLYRFEDGS